MRKLVLCWTLGAMIVVQLCPISVMAQGRQYHYEFGPQDRAPLPLPPPTQPSPRHEQPAPAPQDLRPEPAPAPRAQQPFSTRLSGLVRLIEQGNEPARQEMNRLYLDRDAMAWITTAAQQGNADAQFALGRKYHLGKAGPADYSSAHYWYSMAAAQACAGAECNLGYMHLYGKGTPKSHTKACEWFRRGAEHGDSDAMRIAAERCEGW